MNMLVKLAYKLTGR